LQFNKLYQKLKPIIIINKRHLSQF